MNPKELIPGLTIVIPLYNEQDNIKMLHDKLSQFLKTPPLANTHILFVNDGSIDDSQILLNKYCNGKEFQFLEFEKNYGLSTALEAGFDYCKTQIVGYMDADMQTDVEDFHLLYPYVKDFEMVIGIRVDRKDSFVKYASSKFANGFRRIFTHDGITDTGCPLKLIQTSYAKKMPMFKGMHRFLPALIQILGGRVHQIPVRHYSRFVGESKYNVRNRLLGPLADCFAFLYLKRKMKNYKIKNSG